MRRAILRISPKLLRDVLSLPDGTEILDIKLNRRNSPVSVDIEIYDEDLDDVSDDARLPVVRARFRTFHSEVTTCEGWERQNG